MVWHGRKSPLKVSHSLCKNTIQYHLQCYLKVACVIAETVDKWPNWSCRSILSCIHMCMNTCTVPACTVFRWGGREEVIFFEPIQVSAQLSHSDKWKYIRVTCLYKKAHKTGRVDDRDTLKEVGRNILLHWSIYLCLYACVRVLVCACVRTCMHVCRQMCRHFRTFVHALSCASK